MIYLLIESDILIVFQRSESFFFKQFLLLVPSQNNRCHFEIEIEFLMSPKMQMADLCFCVGRLQNPCVLGVLELFKQKTKYFIAKLKEINKVSMYSGDRFDRRW